MAWPPQLLHRKMTTATPSPRSTSHFISHPKSHSISRFISRSNFEAKVPVRKRVSYRPRHSLEGRPRVVSLLGVQVPGAAPHRQARAAAPRPVGFASLRGIDGAVPAWLRAGMCAEPRNGRCPWLELTNWADVGLIRRWRKRPWATLQICLPLIRSVPS